MEAVAGSDQLRRDTDAVADTLHAALEHVCDLKRAGDLLDPDLFALERKTRRSCRDLQVRDLGQHVEEGLGEPVRKILVVLVVGHVDERKDCH